MGFTKGASQGVSMGGNMVYSRLGQKKLRDKQKRFDKMCVRKSGECTTHQLSPEELAEELKRLGVL